MNLKNKVVVFTGRTAIVLTNPPNLEKYENTPFCVVNPDFSQVSGIEQHFWKLEDGKVLPMNQVEKNARNRDVLLEEEKHAQAEHFTEHVLKAATAEHEASKAALQLKAAEVSAVALLKAKRVKAIRDVSLAAMVAGAAVAKLKGWF